MELVFADVSRFDVIHFHCDYLHFPLLRRCPCPSVTTLHGRLHVPDLRPLFEEYPEVPLVSISDDQRRPIPGANWQATVYHGLPRDLHTFRERPGEYLAFLGRMSPEKRLDRAIEIARRAGMKLEDRRQDLSGGTRLLRADHRAAAARVAAAGSSSSARSAAGRRTSSWATPAPCCFPIDWPEPFGLVMIEAMACGTPVIAWRNGSVPEVIDGRRDRLRRRQRRAKRCRRSGASPA